MVEKNKIINLEDLKVEEFYEIDLGKENNSLIVILERIESLNNSSRHLTNTYYVFKIIMTSCEWYFEGTSFYIFGWDVNDNIIITKLC
jgi:hypothetical protein